ncbi:AMP-dependent synthetase/ligase [Flexistipes sinusarabici]|nr:long-chain fatty acid--CoA ligase [Flexistipes sinusarabici]
MNKLQSYDNIFQLFINTWRQYPDKTAFVYRVNGVEFDVTYNKLFEDVLLLANAFMDKKVTKNSKVAIISDNRYSWIVTDLALVAIGAVSVPRGSDTPGDEFEFIINHSESDFIVFENPDLMKNTLSDSIAKKMKNIFVMEGNSEHRFFNKIYAYNEIIKKDREITYNEIEEFISLADKHKIDDPFTLIYTSGTTGTPKGVLLSNRNFLANLSRIPDMVDLSSDDVWLSILPSWHIFERLAEHLSVMQGCTTVYSNIKTFSDDLKKYSPTIVATVPRLWEALYTKVNATLKKESEKKAKIFNLLVNASAAYRRNKRLLKNNLPVFEKKGFFENIFSKGLAFVKVVLLKPVEMYAGKKFVLLREKFGGRLRLAVSGGGSLPQFVDEWIDAIGIRIVNAYGMTECAPGIAGRDLHCEVFGTLGPPIKDTEIRIVDEDGNILPAGKEGEIQVKGEQVFSGYYKNDEENQKSFTKDGFFKTGDLGKFTLTGELVITGRAKEIIVLANGENIDPTKIESTISMFPFVKDAVLVGQDKKGLGALIVPDFEQMKDYISKKYDKLVHSKEDVTKDSHIAETIKKDINKFLSSKKGFRDYEKLHKISFLDKEFKLGEELTNTLKKKRHYIEKKYRDIINRLFK